MHLNVLACDLDGTLAEDGEVAAETWNMLRRAKTAGLNIILVTGRTMDSFVSEGPYTEVFEAIVAENGAVVYFPRRDVIVLPFGRLAPELLRRLEELKVPLERGIAIAATHVPHDKTILEALRETGGGAAVEYNRGAVMLLPYGATKGTGLHYALNKLGYSPRNVVACGDAENDRSLFRMVELAVAVANASPEVQSLADAVLPKANGAGVRSLIKYLLGGRVPHHRLRPHRRLFPGHKIDGTPLYLDPFALIDGNSGIFGASGSGKSWLAGLLAEELLKQEYQVCIIDPEGDYRGLQAFPNILVLGGSDTHLPSVVDVVTLSEYTCVSLVLDLSVYPVEERTAYVMELLRALMSLRARRGRPHWFLVDEVQSFCPSQGGKLTDLLLEFMQGGGFSIVSYRASQVTPSLLTILDHWMLTHLSLPEDIEVLKPFLAKHGGEPAILSQLSTLPIDQAYLFFSDAKQRTPPLQEIVTLRFAQREVHHVRHLHKYLWAHLPEHKKFYFHDASGRYLGRVAGNLWEFREALGELPVESLQYHLQRGDFERWLQGVFHDSELISRMRKISRRDIQGEALRQTLIEVVIDRYKELSSLF